MNMTLPALLLAFPIALSSQSPSSDATPLRMWRAADSSLGITQHRTEAVRLQGSTIGSAYVAMAMARNDYTDATVDYLLVLTVVDTSGGFYFAGGTSLRLEIDADTVMLSGPGAVISETWEAFSTRRAHLPAALPRGIGHVQVAPYRIAPDLIQRLAQGHRVRLRLTGITHFARRPVFLSRALDKKCTDLLRRFLAQWVDQPGLSREGWPVAFYVPSN